LKVVHVQMSGGGQGAQQGAGAQQVAGWQHEAGGAGGGQQPGV
jgi:hypothetical protein